MNNLYNYKTKKWEKVPEEYVNKAITSGQYTFRGDKPVQMLDGDGSVIEMSPTEAMTVMGQDDSMVSYYSEERKRVDRLKEKYGSTGQEIQTAVEGAARGATLGGSDWVLDKTGLADKEDIKLRQEINPKSAIAGEVIGTVAPMLASGGSSLVAKGIGKVAGKTLGKFGAKAVSVGGSAVRATDAAGRFAGKAGGFAGKFAGAVTRSKGFGDVVGKTVGMSADFAVQGSIYSVANQAHKAFMDDEELTAEGLLYGTLNDVKDSALMGAGLGFGVSVLGKGAKALKSYSDTAIDNYQNRSVDKVAKELGVDSFLKKKHSFFKGITEDGAAVTLKKNADGGYGYRGENVEAVFKGSNVEDNANIFDFDDAQSLKKLGDRFGVDIAKELKSNPNASLRDILIMPRKKANLLAKELQKSGVDIESLSGAEKSFATHASNKREYEKLLRESIAFEKKALEASDSVLSGLTPMPKAAMKQNRSKMKMLQKKIKNADEQMGQIKDGLFGKANKENIKKVNDAIGEFDAIKKGDDLLITNKEVLGKMKGASELGGQALKTQEQKDWIKMGHFTPARVRKIGQKGMKRITEVFKRIYSNGKKRSAAKHMSMGKEAYMEFGEEQLHLLRDEAGLTMSESVEALSNIMQENGLKTGMSAGKLADILEHRLLKKYRVDPDILGSIESKKDFNYVKNNIKELRKQHKTRGVTDLTAQELREYSVNMRKKGHDVAASSESFKAIGKEMHRDLGEIAEKHIQDLMENPKIKTPPDLLGKYKDARKDWAAVMEITEPLEHSLARETVRQQNSRVSYQNSPIAALGGLLGHTVGGIPGAIAGGGLSIAASNVISDAYPYAKAIYKDKALRKLKEVMKDVDVNVEAFFESQYFRGGKVFFADQVTDKDLELLMGTEVAPPEAAIEEFQNNNQTFMDIDPDAANHFLTKKMLLNQKMALSKPKQEDILKNTKVFREDTAEDRKAKMISNLSRNPAAIIKQIGRGFITNEGAEILQTVYPRIHQLIYEKMMEKATDSYFTPRQKMEFKKLFGGSMDASLSPIGMGILQSIHNRSNIEEQEVMENSSSTKRPFRKRSSGNQTDIERRNNR